MKFTNSEALHKEALEHIVGGVNSPSRSYKAVGGGSPVAMERGQGAYFWDVDGNKYIDYLAAYGPIITGHAHPHITKAITHAAETGVLYGTPTKHEVKFAKMLKEAMPNLEKVRFVNSGTEAVMTTIRVARAYTGRDKIIKFAGCYHGHSDLYSSLLDLVLLHLVLLTLLELQKPSPKKSLPFHLIISNHLKKH